MEATSGIAELCKIEHHRSIIDFATARLILGREKP
jgi:hypothetical protein